MFLMIILALAQPPEVVPIETLESDSATVADTVEVVESFLEYRWGATRMSIFVEE